MQERKIDRTMTGNIYTIAEIQTWEDELKRIPQQIEISRQQILPNQSQLNQLYDKWDNIKKQIAPIDKCIDSLKARLELIKLDTLIKEADSKIISHRNILNKLDPALKTIKEQVTPIDEKINEVNICIEIKEAQLSLEEYNRKIISHKNTLTNLHRRFRDLQNELFDINNKMNSKQMEIELLEKEISSAHIEIKQVQTRSTEYYCGGQNPYYSQIPHSSSNYSSTVSTSNAIINANSNIYVSVDDGKAILLKNLQSQLSDLSSQRKRIQDEQSGISIDIRFHQCEVDELNALIKIRQHYLNSTPFNKKEDVKFSDLSDLKHKLYTLNNQKKPLVAEERRLINEIKLHDDAIDDFNQNIQKHVSRKRTLEPIAEEFSHNQDQSDLNLKLQACYSQKTPLDQQKKDLEKEIKHYEIEIRNLNSAIERLKLSQSNLESNQFLKTLRDRPEILFTQLANAISAKFTKYDNEYPADQSISIRICLTEWHDKVKYIEELTDEGEPGEYKQESNSKFRERLKYYQLCGYLWNLLNRIDGPQGNHQFCKLLMSELRTTQLFPSDCIQEYEKVQKLHIPGLREMNNEDLTQREANDYATAYQQLNQKLGKFTTHTAKEIKDFQHKGQILLHAVDQHKHIDIKYCTTVLKTTSQLIDSPANKSIQDKLKFLANHEKLGKPSIAKKVGGAVLAFLGATLIAASVVAKIITLGIASPITTTGIVAGSALLLVGTGLFKSGMRIGTSKIMNDFAKKADKIKNIEMNENEQRLLQQGETFSNTEAETQTLKIVVASAPVMAL